MLKTVTVRTTIAAILTGLSMSAHAIADTARSISVPAGDLVAALESLVKQADIELVYQAEQLRGIHTAGVNGTYEPKEAVSLLLEGTQLTIRIDEATGVILVAPPAAPKPSMAAPSASTGDAKPEEKKSFWSRLRLAQSDTPSPSQGEGRGEDSANREATTGEDAKRAQSPAVTELEEIVVTGTHIRGAEISSPLVTITQETMQRAGQYNLGDVLRALPQSFSGGQNPGVTGGGTGAGGTSNQNVTGASSVNLRGLGPDATLTLLNGSRLPYDGFFQATDISAIPVGAIDRVEVLLDGASAIYGSDAVGGVVNVILKRDFEGAALSARYGEAARGGYVQDQYTGVGGAKWDSGGLIVTGDYSSNTALRARNRSYLDYLPNQDVSIYPSITQRSAVASVHQKVWERVADATVDMYYTDRSASLMSQDVSRFANAIDAESWGVAPHIDFTLPGDWSLAVRGMAGRSKAEREQTQFDIVSGLQTAQAGTAYINRSETAGVEAEGPIAQLPGGAARVSVGGGYRRNSFRSLDPASGATSAFGTDRSNYGFAEVSVPVVSREQNITGVSRLSFSGAFRHEDYDSFGSTTTPKFGVTWGPTGDFDLKASWGKSFKVPTLLQQHQTVFTFLVGPAFGAPPGTTLIWEMGGNQDLEPERATVTTAGIAFHPESVKALSMELSWFRINYRGRVVEPLPGALIFQALGNPLFTDFVTLNPTPAQQQAASAASGLPPGQFTFDLTGGAYDPATVNAIISNRLRNAASQEMHGLDLNFGYSVDFEGSRLSSIADVSWMMGTRRSTRQAAEFDVTGVAYFPPKLRGRAGSSWVKGGLTMSAFVNFVGGVEDTNALVPVKRGSMTTLDAVLDYQLEMETLGPLGFSVSAINLLNRDPPYLSPAQPFDVTFDSTNYSALGRVVSATVRKSF